MEQVQRPRQIFAALALLVTLLVSLLPPRPVHAQTAPPEVQRYVWTGEQAVPIELPLIRNGVEYRVYYITTSEYRPKGLKLFRDASAHLFTSGSITGLLVTANGKVVEDEDTIAEVFSLFRAASFMYEPQQPSSSPIGGITEDFEKSILYITANPVFIEQQLKGLFVDPSEQYAEALRGILSSKIEPPGQVTAFAKEVRMGAGVGKDVGGVVDGILHSAKFSDSRTIRRIAKDTQKTFKSWEPVTDQGKAYAKIAGHRIDFANALDLLELSVDLMFLADLRHERSKWLAEFEAGADGYAIFDAQQAAASSIVQLETENDWLRRSELVLQFVRDKVVDLGVAGLKDGLALKWVKWATDEVGLRGFAHGVASAASTVFVGISISNLLLGLDDLVDSMKIAERANALRHCFYNGRLNAQIDAAKARASGQTTIDGDVAAAYRAAYMLESLAAAQTWRSYADGMGAILYMDLLSLDLSNPLWRWLGNKWDEGLQGMHGTATLIETQAEKAIGHPEFLDPAVQLALNRLAGPASMMGATAVGGLAYDVVLPGETARLVFALDNSGRITWQVRDVQLFGSDKNPDKAPRSLSLKSDVAPGARAKWDISFPVSGTPGVRTVTYRLQAYDEPFGAAVTGYVVLLPPQLKDAEQRIRKKIDELQQKGEQTAEDLMKQITAELERELKKQATNLLNQLQSQCTGALALSFGIIFAGWQGRRRLRR